MKGTCYRAVENQDGTIQLHDLYIDDGAHYNKPCLVFTKSEFEGTWDDENYLIKFFRGIKKNKKKYIKELKQFCKSEDFNYGITLRELLDIYSDSKKLNFWAKKEKAILEHQKPNFNQYLISVGRSLNNYSYDPIKVLNNVHYFADCYDKSIKVKDALDNFSKI